MGGTDHAIMADDLRGTAAENAFAGVRSFMRRPYRKTLDGVDIAIAGFPFDLGTTNRAGARFGPEAIRRASAMISFGAHPDFGFDPFERLAVVDHGDCELPVCDLPGSLSAIEATAAKVLADGARLLALGGDHLISLPLLRAHAARHGPLALVHFDAHMDTTSLPTLTHGSVFHHAAQEGLIDPRRSVQIGLRAVHAVEEFAHNRALGFTGLSAEWVHLNGIEAVVARVHAVAGGGPAYLSFDIDCLDPAGAPGTGTPEPGGLFAWQARAILRRLAPIAFVAMDMVEVAPAYDNAEITALTAAALAFDYLCVCAAGPAQG